MGRHSAEKEYYWGKIIALYLSLHPEEIEHFSYHKFEDDDEPSPVATAETLQRMIDWLEASGVRKDN